MDLIEHVNESTRHVLLGRLLHSACIRSKRDHSFYTSRSIYIYIYIYIHMSGVPEYIKLESKRASFSDQNSFHSFATSSMRIQFEQDKELDKGICFEDVSNRKCNNCLKTQSQRSFLRSSPMLRALP